MKVETRGMQPHLMCEYAPGKWVEVKPDSVAAPAAPGQTTCIGEQKMVFTPGMPAPVPVCEEKSGKQVLDPSFDAKGTSGTATVGKPCGAADWGCQAKEAVTGWFKDLVESAREPAFKLLTATIFGTPEAGSKDMARARELWGTSQVIANSCFVLIITIAGVMLMAGQSLPDEISLRELLPRVTLAFLASNLSLVLIGYGVWFANGLAKAFLAAGGDKVDPATAADVLGNGVQASINTAGIFFVLLALIVVILAVVVGFIYVIRLAITMVLIAAAPLVLMFHALPFTDGIARLWWRGLTGMLAIQVVQALVFITALQLLFTQSKSGGEFQGIPTTKADAIDLLLLIALLWVMIRIPTWIGQTIWRSAQPRVLGQVVKTFLVYRTVGAVLGAVGRTGKAATGKGRAAHHRTPGSTGGGKRRGRHRPGPGSGKGGDGSSGKSGDAGGNGRRRGRHRGGDSGESRDGDRDGAGGTRNSRAGSHDRSSGTTGSGNSARRRGHGARTSGQPGASAQAGGPNHARTGAGRPAARGTSAARRCTGASTGHSKVHSTDRLSGSGRRDRSRRVYQMPRGQRVDLRLAAQRRRAGRRRKGER
ncbi:hypothetical protein ACGFNU_05800 [Spirillospora sp. NPDC048911]|uniref:hypothetical protein n=1 Tax=Spirillospora sp. NPDC048911 TaxID=3364527 RepID=UPI003713A751